MVSVAFEKHESVTKTTNKTDESNSIAQSPFRHVREFHFDLLGYMSYSYSYIGLMTGPFYTYRTFIDMVYHDASSASTLGPALQNLKLLPIMAGPYLMLTKFFPSAYLESDEYASSNGAYQLLVLSPTFTWFRWRFYIGWLLAEAMCMTAGLGLYPKQCKSRPAHGPTTNGVATTGEGVEVSDDFE